MKKIIEAIRKRMTEIYKELEVIEKNEAPTKEDEERFETLRIEFNELKEKEEKTIEKKGTLKEMDTFLNKLTTEPIKTDAKSDKIEPEFASIGEFVKTVRFNPYDERLEKRALSVSTDAKGGFLIPDEFLPQIRMVLPEEVIVRPRAVVIPAGDIPDQKVDMPVLDQTAADGSGIYGGVKVEWIEEGVTKPETDTGFKSVSLEPHEVAGHIVVSDKLLRNAPAVDALLNQLFRGAINAAEEDSFLNNALATRPLGIIPHACTIAVNRVTANRVTYADIVKMFASKLSGGSYIWAASSTIIEELMKMKDFEAADSDAPNLVWQPNARAGMAGTLIGLPLLNSDLVPTLGTKGDISLCNFKYYLIKDGYGIAIAASEHVYFTKNKTVIKAFWNVDGKPWLSAPITLRDGTTTVSPFVVLDIPGAAS